MKIKLLLVFCFFSFNTFAQKGLLKGIVKDSDINDALPFAYVIVKDAPGKGTTTDFEGAYTLFLDAGTYTIVFKYVGYEAKEVTGIEINTNEVTVFNISLSPVTASLDAVVITAEAARDTEASVLNVQRKSVNLLDGLSAQNFKNMGAGNIASAVKSIPGVAIQGGKHVYVRGLGDRYTKTLLNSVDIPGLDPDKNAVQLDLFPTNILDNVMVIKSFTTDLPADFTGGIVNIITKEIPTEREFKVSVSGNYNTKMHFNNRYLSNEGGSTTFLGFDTNRNIPIDPNMSIPNTFDSDRTLTEITQRFNPTLSALNNPSGMDVGLGISYSDLLTVGKNENDLGFYVSVNYKSETKFYEEAIDNVYRKDETDFGNNELVVNRMQKGSLGISNIILNGMVGLTLKTDKSKYKLNILHIQNGESSAGVFRQELSDSDFATFKKDNLEYTQRGLTNGFVSGKHTNEDATWNTEWRLSSTMSSIDDKDVRTTPFQEEEGTFTIAQNNQPRRIWRSLNEQNYVGKLDFTKKYELAGKKTKLKFGVYSSYKTRDYIIYSFQIGVPNSTLGYKGNANNILREENLWTSTQDGTYIDNTTIVDPANVFDASQTNMAGYVSNEFKVGKKIKTILGLRAENYAVNYTGENTQGVKYENETVLDNLDLFPSVNIIYSVAENKNLRLSYSKTTARPSFKEVSTAEIFDALLNRFFIGNIDIKPTFIDNLDVRFEFFGKNAQMFSISGFYKAFKDPIELTYFAADPRSLTPRNLGSAMVYGVELEFRKDLSFIGESLENLKFKFNTSLMKSSLEIGTDELLLRKNTARTGENISTTRNLQGQAPFLFNVGLDYDNNEKEFRAGLFYNVQGETLQVVGGALPDVYTMPFHSLNFTLNKSLGKNRNSDLSIKLKNILGGKNQSVYQSFGAQNQTFSLRDPGTSISVGYSVRF